jgi:hypothetical protein
MAAKPFFDLLWRIGVGSASDPLQFLPKGNSLPGVRREPGAGADGVGCGQGGARKGKWENEG